MKLLTETKTFQWIAALALVGAALTACGESKTAEPAISEQAVVAKPETATAPVNPQVPVGATFTLEDFRAAEDSPVALFSIADFDTDGPHVLNWELTYADDYLTIKVPSDAAVGTVIQEIGEHFTSELTIEENSSERIRYKGRIVEEVVPRELQGDRSLVSGQVIREYVYTYTPSDQDKASENNHIVIVAQGAIDLSQEQESTFAVQVTMNYPLPEPTNSADFQKKFNALLNMDWKSQRAEMEQAALEILNSPESEQQFQGISALGSVKVGEKSYDFQKIAKIGHLGFLIAMSQFDDPS